MTSKKLAVILSVYKNDRPLEFEWCIRSLLEQTYQKIDIWIQFDGKVDPAIESFLQTLDKGSIYVRKRLENKGLAFSLNELLAEVLQHGYAYIARMDADDLCLPERFEHQIDYLESHPDVDIVGGYIREIDEHGKGIALVRYPLVHEEMKCFFGKRNPLAHMTVVFRKSYFMKAGLYPTHTHKDEDTMFWLQGFLSGCVFANINKVVVNVRVTSDFYRRRAGWEKSFSDFKNRCTIIRSLHLSSRNYLFAFGRFVLFVCPFPRVIHVAYKFLR